MTKGEKKFAEAQQKIKNSKCFVVVMSRGDNVRIDGEELQKVLQARKTGQDVIVKQGIINMAFYVQIKKDIERRDDSLDKNWDYRFQIEHGQRQPQDGLIPLENIFRDMKLLPEGKKPKELS